jgi:hypothetical protein
MPTRPEQAGIRLELLGYACSLGLSFGYRASDRVTAIAEIGPGLDINIRTTLGVPDSSYGVNPGIVAYRPLSYLSLGARGELGLASLTAAFVLTVPWQRTRYEYVDAGQTKPLFQPWPVQPGLTLGLSW